MGSESEREISIYIVCIYTYTKWQGFWIMVISFKFLPQKEWGSRYEVDWETEMQAASDRKTCSKGKVWGCWFWWLWCVRRPTPPLDEEPVSFKSRCCVCDSPKGRSPPQLQRPSFRISAGCHCKPQSVGASTSPMYIEEFSSGHVWESGRHRSSEAQTPAQESRRVSEEDPTNSIPAYRCSNHDLRCISWLKAGTNSEKVRSRHELATRPAWPVIGSTHAWLDSESWWLFATSELLPPGKPKEQAATCENSQ